MIKRFLMTGALLGIAHPEGDVTVRVLSNTLLEIEGEKEIDMRDFGLEPPVYVEPKFRVGIRVGAERGQ